VARVASAVFYVLWDWHQYVIFPNTTLVLSRAEWDGLELAKILLGLLIKLLPESWPILVAVDETLERRRGKKIKAKGIYRDAVQSTQSNVVTSYGLKWEAMMLIVPLPWCKRSWALPFLTVLAPSKRSNEAAVRKPFETRATHAPQGERIRKNG